MILRKSLKSTKLQEMISNESVKLCQYFLIHMQLVYLLFLLPVTEYFLRFFKNLAQNKNNDKNNDKIK